MTRIVPHPILTGALIVMWLLLNRFSLGHLLLGTAIALVAGRAMAALEPVRPRLRRPDLVLTLFARVMLDILRSNVAVARLVLADRPGRRPGFVEIDLTFRDPTALASARGHHHQHARHRLGRLRRRPRPAAHARPRPRERGRVARDRQPTATAAC